MVVDSVPQVYVHLEPYIRTIGIEVLDVIKMRLVTLV